MPVEFTFKTGERAAFASVEELASFVRQAGLVGGRSTSEKDAEHKPPGEDARKRRRVSAAAQDRFDAWTAALAKSFYESVTGSAQQAIKVLLVRGTMTTSEIALVTGKDGRVAGGIKFSADKVARDMGAPSPIAFIGKKREEKSVSLDAGFTKAAKEAGLSA